MNIQDAKRAGVEIVIKNPTPFAKGIYRINGRKIEIRLKTGKSIKNISILNTYAAHIGYPTDALAKYWEYIEAYISLLPKNPIKIRRNDNNGQLSRNDANYNYIGKWTTGGLGTPTVITSGKDEKTTYG